MLTLLLNCTGSLVQTVPPSSAPVCPGRRLVFTCTTNDPNLYAFAWITDFGVGAYVTDMGSALIGNFTVTARRVNGFLVSTAFIESVPVQLNGKNISCTDDIDEQENTNNFVTLIINVKGICSIIIINISYII